MNLTKSSNPVFGNNIFTRSAVSSDEGVMTINGTVNEKIGMMLAIVLFAAAFTWRKFMGDRSANPGVMPSGIMIWR